MSERNFKTREGYDIWDALCAIPKFGFLIGPTGGVVKVADIGDWIDRHEAQKVFDEAQSEVNLLRADLDALRAENERLMMQLAALSAPAAGPDVSTLVEVLRTTRMYLETVSIGLSGKIIKDMIDAALAAHKAGGGGHDRS